MNIVENIKSQLEELRNAKETKYDMGTSDKITKLAFSLPMLERLPKKYQRYTFDTLEETPGNKEAIEAVKNININDGEFILLYGNAGNGKTHLAVAGLLKGFLDSLDNKGIFSIGYVELSEYFRQQRARMNGEQVHIPDYAKFDLLVIDDLGKIKPSEWNYQEMFNLLERRWANERATIITTNHSLEELPSKLSPSDSPDMAMLSRITSGKTFEILGKDRRQDKKS